MDGRRIAWEVLTALDDGRHRTVAAALADHARAEPQELALARELALGVVRHRGLYDAVARQFLRPGAQPPALLRILRLIAHQLFALDRIPPHAAVASGIDLLRAVGLARLTGVANAVARRLAEQRLAERDSEQPDPALGRLLPSRWPAELHQRASLPLRLVADLRSVAPDGERSFAWLNRVAPLCTRWRQGEPHDLPGTGVLRREGPWVWWAQPEAALRGPVASGLAVVQDRSQGALLELAQVRAGELVLDLCAAPGGKTTWLLDHACRVVAADRNAAKVQRLAVDLRGRAACLIQDGRAPALAPAFDLVVVDAPCSNSGVVARRPEARWRYDEEHLQDLTSTQQALLAGAAGCVAPGGRLLYTTCSLAPRENGAVAHGLRGWRVERELLRWPDAWSAGGYGALLVRA